MNSSWQDFLASCGAALENGIVVNFGEPKAELDATRSGTVLADLSRYGLLTLAGEDAQAFLQGQLSSDLRQVSLARAQYSSYNSAKGRMLATLLLWQSPSGYHLQLAAELAEPVRKRLSMFILRSRVKAADASDRMVRLGVSGPAAETLAAQHFPQVPRGPLEVAHHGGASLIRLAQERFEIISSPDQGRALWSAIAQGARPVGAACWEWLDIRAGIPWVTATTQEQFVPQMANLEAIGGVSFQKGCYPGQEIVARTQYLGKLKRRMYLAHLDTDIPPEPGDELFSGDLEDQASGMIVNAAPSPDGGYDALAVVQTSSAETGPVRWKALCGPALKFMPLPYPV